MKKIKNKLLLIGSVVSTSSFLALSASCSNKNEEEIKVENPNDNTQNEAKINFDNQFLLNLDKEYFNFGCWKKCVEKLFSTFFITFYSERRNSYLKKLLTKNNKK